MYPTNIFILSNVMQIIDLGVVAFPLIFRKHLIIVNCKFDIHTRLIKSERMCSFIGLFITFRQKSVCFHNWKQIWSSRYSPRLCFGSLTLPCVYQWPTNYYIHHVKGTWYPKKVIFFEKVTNIWFHGWSLNFSFWQVDQDQMIFPDLADLMRGFNIHKFGLSEGCLVLKQVAKTLIITRLISFLS